MANPTPEPLRSILDLARWTPSGDNSQPWRFEVRGDHQLVVHVRRENDVYDFGGLATRITCGALFESIRIAASQHRAAIQWQPLSQDADWLRFKCELLSGHATPDPLAQWMMQRSVDRRPYCTRRLTTAEKAALEAAVQAHCQIRWFESAPERFAVTRLNALATWIRLTIPETFPIHQRIIDWDHPTSQDRVPAAAIGLDPMTRKLMRWVMQDWRRSQFMNRFLAGPMVPSLEMDWLPGLMCGAHFAFINPQWHTTQKDELIGAGEAVQRFWLTATQLGLVMQPAFATLTFSYYGERDIPFSSHPAAGPRARALSRKFQALYGRSTPQVPFIGRIGAPRAINPARSTRKTLDELMWDGPASEM